MKPAICTSFDATLPFVEAMSLIRQTGFEVVSIGARPEHSEYHFKILEKYGPRLCIVHLHDNSGEDSHRLPYEGDTDWPQLMSVLRGLGYSRSLLLEADLRNSQFKDRTVFLAEAWQRAQRLLRL
jgi:sugar phosphate isomerase/epimerase